MHIHVLSHECMSIQRVSRSSKLIIGSQNVLNIAKSLTQHYVTEYVMLTNTSDLILSMTWSLFSC